MARDKSGAFKDNEVYTAPEIGMVMGISTQQAKNFIRGQIPSMPGWLGVVHLEPFEGKLLVHGRRLNAAIDEFSEFDSEERAEARKRKSGSRTRKQKEEAAK